ncbi:MAG: beta-N-acetylhexosaminidase, partial [Muribaculaceae bacterium]|nr:beta-N-acetylhexosaminidase [Muribaculaceae bacterium]
MTVSDKLPDEGYRLNVTADGASVEASSTSGLYFAFQSLKKMLPPNVMAGVADKAVTEYVLPVVSISDKPRFPYRGFMLDVSRHFFTIDEVKRMLDVMSYYKLNRFHWHLTDDQGWRIEMPQYPRLTTVGATAPNSRFTDMNSKSQYWINHPYGPYFYTQDELREVVAYAKERHIEVIPEVDMPGHFCAAMAAYPEFSCNPGGSHSVWDDGGISSDVLNVANPAAVQFAKDVLTTLMDIFPYPSIHIGGDECPTSAWENNAECKDLYKRIGAKSWRELQSNFIMELNDHVKASGRTLSMWDESISASGADTEKVKQTDAFIYCWTVGTADAAAKLGTSLGLRCIYTPWGPYYINRRQNQADPPGAGDGTDDVRATYLRT